ncbi:CRISPR locus-related DNA-binding protein (plasmid) [Halarchaeum sp. CBA1220]|uniref:CRISPR-associated CARF protein Csa3 n=1 Tax=Halarchaeum sp. CBA1220 TaxID=1853682 RepID=UPI000F3A86CB|nr:CRISPR-associated CARF protein Csa3 [Halarchaeum sp. CBA1220]QLC35070.1 CRISPR locus-related DNA-binding protein [Halarchaeum sp. CBA1220]
MRTYVSTIGHYSPRVMRPILNNGLDADDVVVLLRPRDDASDRAASAIQDVEQTVNELGPGSEVVVEEISYEAFETAVIECVDVLEAADGTVVLNFDGGPREIFLPLTVAAIARPTVVDLALQFRDVDEEIEELTLPNLMSRPSDATLDTLRYLVSVDGGTTLPRVSDETDKSRSTVGRHLDALEADGAVETWMEGKTRHAAPTLAGQLHV